MDLLTKFISAIFSNRISKIDSFGNQAVDIQKQQLKHLLFQARHTTFGEKYRFDEIRDYNAFSERVPTFSYEEIQPYIERMINGEKNLLWTSGVRWYAKSSGTTNDRSKYIPVPKEYLRNCHYKGSLDSILLYLKNNPQSRFFSKKGLVLGGSHKLVSINSQAHCGDLSAVLLQNMSSLANLLRVPAKEIILMDEWEAKIKAIVEHTYNKDVLSISGVPSWMLVLLDALLKKTGKTNILEIWKNLEVFFHGGIGFEPYQAKYKEIIPSDQMRYVEIYNASEGFFGIQDDLTQKSMLLMLDYGIFYEFMQMCDLSCSQKIIPLADVKPDVNYEVLITTAGGLWRYRIGDTVRFTSVFPHKFVITGRTKQFINAFGEELMVDNAEKGVKAACLETDAIITTYTAAPLFRLDKGQGCHQWIIEFEKPPVSLDIFAEKLDKALQTLNSDYEAKRYKSMSLSRLEIIPARKNLFYDWLKKHDRLGGQHKVPRLSNNRDLIEELLEMNQ
jgi:hypothetical protein